MTKSQSDPTKRKKEKKLKPHEQAFQRQESLVHDFFAYLCTENAELNALKKSTQKKVKKLFYKNQFKDFEKIFIFRIAFMEAKEGLNLTSKRELSVEEIKLDTEGNPKEKLNHFHYYYDRLHFEEKSILILRDQLGFSYEDIASITTIPQGTIEVKRSLTITKLCDWIYGDPKDEKGLSEIEKTLSLPLDEVLKTSAKNTQSESESRWKRTPWFLRSGFESLMFGLAILIVVIMVPKIRDFYESSIEKRLDAFDLADLNATKDEIAVLKANLLKNTVFGTPECEISDPSMPSIGCSTKGAPVFEKNSNQADSIRFSFSNEELAEINSERSLAAVNSTAPQPQAFKNVKVGNSEIWRFNIRTDSPDDLREMVKEYLSGLKSEEQIAGMEGIKAPGGIQFNLLVPKEYVAGLKNRMHVLANDFVGSTQESETFTWYKIKSRKRIPSGKTRVVIWLSQI